MLEKIFSFIFIFLFIMIMWRVLSERYKLPCPTWLAWMVEQDNPFCKINRAATIIKNINLEQGMSVLDIGCGPGRVTIPIAKKIGPAGEIFAMDIQEGMLEKVHKKALIKNLNNIHYIQAGIGENKLEHNKFDRILLVTVLGEIPDKQAAIQEIFNALKPGGILSITEIIFDPHFQTRTTVRKITQSVGLKEKAFFGNYISFTINFEK